MNNANLWMNISIVAINKINSAAVGYKTNNGKDDEQCQSMDEYINSGDIYDQPRRCWSYDQQRS